MNNYDDIIEKQFSFKDFLTYIPYKEKLCGIYRLINTANGHSYIGLSNNIRERH